MKNKLIFRILGALSSALIIVSVFVPFVKVTGYSQSLWQTNINTLYLPIIIIVFGSIGVLLFAINFKTELAYSTTGALLFFLITQTIPIIKQGTFNTLNIGYYFLVVGTLLTGVMTFLCSLKTKMKKVVEEVKVEEPKEDFMLNQIDRLYENEPVQNSETEINELEMIQPLQTTESFQPITQNNGDLNIPTAQNITPLQNLSDMVQPDIQVNQQEEPKTIVAENNEQSVNIEEQEVNKVSNPIVSEFSIPETNIVESESIPTSNLSSAETSPLPTINPVVSEFETVKQEEPISNPVVSEFTTPEINGMNNIQIQPQPTINPVVSEIDQSSDVSSNPVVSQFETPSQFSFGAPSTLEQTVENKQEQPQNVEDIQPLQPLGSNMDKVDVMADQATMTNNNSSNLDIFG